MAVDAEVFAAEARYSAAEVDIIRTRNEEQQAMERLRSLLAVDPDKEIILADSRTDQVPSRPASLAELDDGVHAELVIEAARAARIRARLAARCVARLPFDPMRWLELLISERVADRRLATELVYLLLRREDRAARERLDALGEPGRRAVQRCLDADDLYMLPDKRDVLSAWAAG